MSVAERGRKTGRHSHSNSLRRRIQKSAFVKLKNNGVDHEPYVIFLISHSRLLIIESFSFVECIDCGRKMHKICVLHNEYITQTG